jgi:membrane-associated phospholipid phosphatase
VLTTTSQFRVSGLRLGDRLGAYRAPLLLGTLFAFLTLNVELGSTASLDRLVESHTGVLSSGLWADLRFTADPAVAALGLTIGCLVLWHREGVVTPIVWCVGLAAGMLVELALKWQLHQIPFDPPERLWDTWVLSGSYPSGHATRAVILAGIACAVAPRLRWLWIGWAVLMTAWILASGMHLMSDTLGGVLLGGTVVAAIAAYSSRATRLRPEGPGSEGG